MSYRPGRMTIKRVPPAEAAELQKQGFTYVDVRSAPEFASGRPTGSVNIPVFDVSPNGQMVPNPEFLDVFTRAFPSGSKVVVGCQGGNRSMRAAQMLEAAGYSEIVEQQAGFGAPGGWASQGLPVERGAAPGADYESMKSRR